MAPASLNRRDEILALAHALPEKWRGGTLREPQILLQFPHVGPEPEIVFHLDEEPAWAAGLSCGRSSSHSAA